MKKTGKFLNIPYDFRLPTWKRIKERCWNSNDPQIFTPKAFGYGWTINFYQVLRKLKRIKNVLFKQDKI